VGRARRRGRRVVRGKAVALPPGSPQTKTPASLGSPAPAARLVCVCLRANIGGPSGEKVARAARGVVGVGDLADGWSGWTLWRGISWSGAAGAVRATAARIRGAKGRPLVIERRPAIDRPVRRNRTVTVRAIAIGATRARGAGIARSAATATAPPPAGAVEDAIDDAAAAARSKDGGQHRQEQETLHTLGFLSWAAGRPLGTGSGRWPLMLASQFAVDAFAAPVSGRTCTLKFCIGRPIGRIQQIGRIVITSTSGTAAAATHPRKIGRYIWPHARYGYPPAGLAGPLAVSAQPLSRQGSPGPLHQVVVGHGGAAQLKHAGR
jgi:hypothetical protein